MTDRSITFGMLAEMVGGQVDGDSATMIRGAAVLRDVARGEITFVDQQERVKQLAATEAAAVVLPAGIDCNWPRALARAKDVHAAFTKIVTYFRPPRTQAAIGVSPQAIVARSAQLGKGVNVHPGATIGDDCTIGDDDARSCPALRSLPGCTIGSGVLVGPGAVLYENTVVGDRSIIHGGAVIGAYGFGYSQVDGKHVPSAQLGYVAHRLATSRSAPAPTIDRGTYGATTIGDGTKIDNLVQIAHNCQIGRHNLICSQVGIAGSTTTGDYVVMGGQAGVRDHVHIGQPRDARRDGGHYQRRARRRRDDGRPRHARPRTKAQASRLRQAARDAQRIQGDAPGDRRPGKGRRHQNQAPHARLGTGRVRPDHRHPDNIVPPRSMPTHATAASACWPPGDGCRCWWPRSCGGRDTT